MTIIDRIIELVQSHQGEHLVLEDNQEILAYRADGTAVPTKDRLSAAQIREVLSEIVPADCQAFYESGASFRFQYAYGSDTVNIEVSQTDQHVRVSAALSPATVFSGGAPPASPSSPEPQYTEVVAASPPFQEGESSVPTDEPTTSTAPPSLQAHAEFPKDLPKSLRWTESRIRISGSVIGFALGLVTSVAAYLLIGKDSLLGQVFDLRKVTTAIPVFISCLFFWSATVCFLRWRRLRQLEIVSRRTLLVEATRILSTASSPAALSQELQGESIEASPLLRRLQAVIRQWQIRPGLQDADLVLQQHVANDEEGVHAGYSLVRTFVWALPVLGLIGTVIGISLAVSGFAKFLSGDINDVAIVKQNLVSVTGGLSFAFLITLHGLLTSLLVMLAASVLQTREEKLYTTIQHDIAETFLPVLQRVEPESQAAPGAADLDAWREILQRVAQDVLQVVQTGGTKLMDVIDERERIHHEKISLWTQTWDKILEDSAVRLGQVIEGVGAEVSTANGHLVEHLNGVRESLAVHAHVLQKSIDAQTRAASEQERTVDMISAQTDVVRATAEILAGLIDTTKSALECQTTLQAAMAQLGELEPEQIEAIRTASDTLAKLTEIMRSTLEGQTTLQAAMRQLSELKSEQTEAVQESTHTLAKLSDMTRSALDCQTTLQAAMQQLSELNWEGTFVAYVGALSEQSHDLRTTTDAVRDLTLLIKEVHAAQTVLQVAISQLHATNFEQTLAGFRDSLVALSPILDSFRKPFVFQAVPLDGPGRGQP